MLTVAAVLQGRGVVVEVVSHGFIWWMFLGLLAGWIAGHLTRGRGVRLSR